ncbi:MAG: hypothetical protein E7H32_08185 [Anaerococcus sp.]|uniref:hypothetical protein n=1 Tax=Anaerococcus sp. TaxID=1872515 RepID=UPI002910B6A2|nr:hypothetical protein [Anaerococcus sp.]MDU4026639.1 hypothetical protein [Anaerococcus sp.]
MNEKKNIKKLPFCVLAVSTFLFSNTNDVFASDEIDDLIGKPLMIAESSVDELTESTGEEAHLQNQQMKKIYQAHLQNQQVKKIYQAHLQNQQVKKIYQAHL